MANAKTFWARVEILGPDDCWEWQAGRTSEGYGQVWHAGKPWRAHKLAWFFAHGPTELQILHRCDNRPCCNPAHLFTGTTADNVKDMIAKGRQRSTGGIGKQAKLTVEQVLEIRRLASEGYSDQALAVRFEITARTIFNIVERRTWKHL